METTVFTCISNFQWWTIKENWETRAAQTNILFLDYNFTKDSGPGYKDMCTTVIIRNTVLKCLNIFNKHHSITTNYHLLPHAFAMIEFKHSAFYLEDKVKKIISLSLNCRCGFQRSHVLKWDKMGFYTTLKHFNHAVFYMSWLQAFFFIEHGKQHKKFV